MKKKMIVLLAAAMMTLAAGNAMAAFGNNDLLRVVYDTTSTGTFEMVTDLGSLSSLQGKTNDVVGGGAASIVNLLPGVGTYSVAYFAGNATGVASTSGVAIAVDSDPVNGITSAGIYGSKASSVINGTMLSVYNYYATLTPVTVTNVDGSTSTSAVGSKSNGNSYFVNLDGSGSAPGTMGGLSQNPTNTEVPLSLLVSTISGKTVVTGLGSVDQMTLYNFAKGNTKATSTTPYLTLTTNADGSTTINKTATTPIPAAIYLMGSGLLGMFGLRRKNRG